MAASHVNAHYMVANLMASATTPMPSGSPTSSQSMRAGACAKWIEQFDVAHPAAKQWKGGADLMANFRRPTNLLPKTNLSAKVETLNVQVISMPSKDEARQRRSTTSAFEACPSGTSIRRPAPRAASGPPPALNMLSRKTFNTQPSYHRSLYSDRVGDLPPVQTVASQVTARPAASARLESSTSVGYSPTFTGIDNAASETTTPLTLLSPKEITNTFTNATRLPAAHREGFTKQQAQNLLRRVCPETNWNCLQAKVAKPETSTQTRCEPRLGEKTWALGGHAGAAEGSFVEESEMQSPAPGALIKATPSTDLFGFTSLITPRERRTYALESETTYRIKAQSAEGRVSRFVDVFLEQARRKDAPSEDRTLGWVMS